jgi:hypothetical protein
LLRANATPWRRIVLFARPPRAFSSLFPALLAVLPFFFPPPCIFFPPPGRRRGTRAPARPRAHARARARARAAFRPPRTASIFLFERLRGHAPAPQWPRARKFVAGAAPFPAAPASFSPIPLASRRRARAPPAPLHPPPPPPLSRAFPLAPPAFFPAPPAVPAFFSSHLLPPRPAADVDVDVDVDRAIPPSRSLARSPASPPASPQGCILRGPSTRRLAVTARDTSARGATCSILEAH